MVLGVAVTHDHGDILADTLSAQSSLGEGSSHGEEVNQTVIMDGQDCGHLAGLDVHAADGDIILLTAVGGQSSFHNLNGLGAVSDDHVGVHAQLHQVSDLGLLADNTHDLAVLADLLHGLVAAQDGGLAVGAQDQDTVALLGELAGLSRSTGHVQSSQSQRLGHIVGQLGIQSRLKQDGLALDVHAVDILVDRLDLVDAQGGHGQGDQRSDLVADLQVEVGLLQQVLTDVSNLADEHTAGTGHGVLLLAALSDNTQDHFADLLLIAAAGLRNLSEGSGVDVQRDDIADDLVGVDLGHIVVDLPSSLGQNTLGLNHSVSTVLVAFQFCHNSFPPK